VLHQPDHHVLGREGVRLLGHQKRVAGADLAPRAGLLNRSSGTLAPLLKYGSVRTDDHPSEHATEDFVI
jgi:hypothetical protein